MENSEVYLKAMMSLVARQTYPPERLVEAVTPVANTKTYEAYNLCDGSRTQTEVATALKMDPAQLSRSVRKWIDDGIMLRISDGGGVKPVHVYPIPERFMQQAKKKPEVKKDG